MGFRVEQECPQCGAPIELDETDRILLCPWCGVKNFIHTPRYFRYTLPHNGHENDIIHVPYLRFRGSVFFCKNNNIGHRIIDITQTGIKLEGLPLSLGLRPQAMKLRFAAPDTKGTFLRFELKAADILSRAAKLSSGSENANIAHRAFIGETMSIIYSPHYLKDDMLFDAILNRPLAQYRHKPDSLEKLFLKRPDIKMNFIPALCPDCGWGLEGEKDSIVLICRNCQTAWEAVDGRLVHTEITPVRGSGKEGIYLPFWKLNVIAHGVELKSFADFIRLTNQPRVIKEAWESSDMNFWIPAFRIRPQIFLSLAKQFTVIQKDFPKAGRFPENLFSASLPCSEAVQALKITLAFSTLTKNNLMSRLSGIRFKVKKSSLMYLPFEEGHHEIFQEHTGININKNSLEYGKALL